MKSTTKREAYDRAEAEWFAHEAGCPACLSGGKCLIGGRLLVAMGEAAKELKPFLVPAEPI